MSASAVQLTYAPEGLRIVLPPDVLHTAQCLCGDGWAAHNPHPQGTTAYDRYCLRCPCLGFIPALRALGSKEETP